MQLYTDAATTAVNDQSGAGILIINDGHQHQFKQILPASDNHTAEFLAAIAGFKILIDTFGTQQAVFFYTDSQIVAESVDKAYSKSFSVELATLLALQDQCQVVITQWIPESDNHGAHQLAQQGLHLNDHSAGDK
ncbi:RNase H family protein [Lactiplantibacillus fabifermentans]|uniref:Cell wall enzyme n=2 Tax=Lactiplantibacillus fabifermentans TaxID=483011 RepID=A0A0R2NQL6_9LACO|nr:RNase H family protein [Lactiplantibacillus fabifermentans]ETY74325.1 ribonuclease HI [Lactiplantibacillus fabifermentans T30PCM01]KRO27019.1 cell wall enzyme [Lactiplantibacillus fabifermentans DSM 21115]